MRVKTLLTKRQKEVLDFIVKYQTGHGYAPSLDEIKKKFKLASVSTAHFHVARLQKSKYLIKKDNRARSIVISDDEPMVSVSLLGTIMEGQPIEPLPEKESIAIPKHKLPRDRNIYALRALGDSMNDENINDGDVVLIKRQSTARNGQKVVAFIDNYETTLKKYYKKRGQVRLQSTNKNLEPLIIKSGQSLLIQGVVIDVIRADIVGTRRAQPVKVKTILQKKRIKSFVNQVIEGDCLDIMKGISAKSIDMVLCDLPYGTTQNQWDGVIPFDQLWENYERIVKDKGAIVLTAQGAFSAKLILSNPKLFKYKTVWVKSKPTNFLNAKKQPLRKHEDVLIFYKQQPSYTPQMSKGEPYNKGFRKDQLSGSYGDFKTVEVKSNGERYPTDVIYFKTAETEGAVCHPTQKPVELGRYFIRTFTKPGDVVLDNACGSGSFLIAAILEGRKFIGIEKNEEVYIFKNKEIDYIKVCEQRIKDALERYQETSSSLF